MKTRAERLVQDLTQRGILNDKRLIRAFLNVPLKRFIPRELIDERRIYQDIPQLFYYRAPNLRRTISAPHMICIMLQNLCLEENDNLLILGSKSGYISAIASHLCAGGEIFIVEAIKELVDITRNNLDKTGFGKNISIIHSSVVYGLKDSAPWQKILVTGQVEKEDLDYVIYQLDPNGGMLFAPIGPPYKQDFTQIIRNGDDFYFKTIGEVIFGPLDLFEPTVSPDDKAPPSSHRAPPPITFKLDLGTIDNKIRNFMDKYLIGEQKSTKTNDDVILHSSIKLAKKYSGFVNIITIADHLDIEPEDVIKVLKNYKRGLIEDFGTSNIATMLFILKDESEETINQSKEILRNILNIVKKMKNEYKSETALDLINEIEENIEKLSEFGPKSIYKIKTLKNITNTIRSNILHLIHIEDKIGSNKKFLEQSQKITNTQIEELENLNDLLKEILKKLNDWS